MAANSSIGGPWDLPSTRLRESAPYRRLLAEGGEAVRLPVPAAAWVGELLAEDLGRPLLVVVPHEVNAYAWLEAANLFRRGDGEAVYFPAPSLSPYQETEVSLQVRAAEAVALDAILRGGVRTVVTTPLALFRRLPRVADHLPAVRILEPEEEHPVDELAEHLVRWGYHRSDLVFEVGHFAVRGGVFDVYPPGEPGPVRLDLFGDTIETLRRFEAESQRSQEILDSVRILPLSLFPQGMEEAELLADLLMEMTGTEAGPEVAERLGSLRSEGGFDGWQHYLPLVAGPTETLADLMEDPLVLALDAEALFEEAEHHTDLLAAELAGRVEVHRLAVPPEELEHPLERVEEILSAATLRIGDLLQESTAAIDFGGASTEILHDQLPRFPREVDIARGRGDRVYLVASEEHLPKMGELLRERDIEPGPAGVELVSGELQRGFRLATAGVTLFGERQLLRRGPLVKRRSKKARYGPFLSSLRDLRIGDFIVHVDHGIGQFVGLRNLGGETSDTSQLPPELAATVPEARQGVEVMEIVYSNGRRLLLPLSRLDQVQKYSGIEGLAPRLDRLGGSSWKRTRQRIKKGMRDMAEELLKLYAERQMAVAPRVAGEARMSREFAAAFEHEETADQLEAIEEIFADLSSERPMDRLLCGDVGFGKTEVAMRAAFRAVEEGYQVAVLAPTTILADQHLETFRSRFKNFAVEIEMISRFRTAAEVREIQKRAEDGKIDVLIGTHRLLSSKVKLPNLALLIVDEEQRFGVAHKERLKKLKKNIHVLAMSATPVPRTLQLSLAGVRDLSLIETPPRDRMAVETAILPFDTAFLREAIEFEKARGGQVYYVYNRVETIDDMAGYLKEIVPGLKVTVGHGQLDEKELARRMHAFVAEEYDLLLATTIIENGIDIPNVNTMIVHRADRFGLSQLYQLRGRVGRSDQLAYCYLLVPPDRILSEDARKRLQAIREFSELGAGFRVAGRDLEIRGAGNLLGGEQSGHIAAVGIETYLKMLEETVAELKGEAPAEGPSVTMDLPIQMAIPESYVGDANLRMEIYQRLATAEEAEEVLLLELRDRFGPPPEGVRTLLQATVVKRMAEDLRLQSISAARGKVVLRLRQDARVEPERLIELVSEHPGASFSPSGDLTLPMEANAGLLPRLRELLEYLGGFEGETEGGTGQAAHGGVQQEGALA